MKYPPNRIECLSAGDVGFDDRELLREASSIEDSLFQTPAPIGDASALAGADQSDKMDDTFTPQDDFVANDGFGDDDDAGGLGTSLRLHAVSLILVTNY